jgi:hypothetical protein
MLSDLLLPSEIDIPRLIRFITMFKENKTRVEIRNAVII